MDILECKKRKRKKSLHITYETIYKTIQDNCKQLIMPQGTLSIFSYIQISYKCVRLTEHFIQFICSYSCKKHLQTVLCHTIVLRESVTRWGLIYPTMIYNIRIGTRPWELGNVLNLHTLVNPSLLAVYGYSWYQSIAHFLSQEGWHSQGMFCGFSCCWQKEHMKASWFIEGGGFQIKHTLFPKEGSIWETEWKKTDREL